MLFKWAACHLGMEMGDVQLKLVRANPVKQLWLGNKKWGTNLQVYSCCLPVRDPKDAEMLTRTGRAERLTPGQILLWSDLQDGNRPAACETSDMFLFPLQTVLVLVSLGRYGIYLHFGTQWWENLKITTQEWLFSFWTGNICDGEIPAAPQISSWHLWEGQQSKAATQDLKHH